MCTRLFKAILILFEKAQATRNLSFILLPKGAMITPNDGIVYGQIVEPVTLATTNSSMYPEKGRRLDEKFLPLWIHLLNWKF